MKDFAESFYKSKAWQRCRASFVKARGGLCERCMAEGIAEAGVIVHHKIELTPENIGRPEVTLSFDNLELLCRRHHAEAHGARQRRYKIDDAGNVTAL